MEGSFKSLDSSTTLQAVNTAGRPARTADDSASPYSWRPMVDKCTPISDSRITYDTLIHRVTWTGAAKPNPMHLARGLTMRVIDGAAVSHASECEEEDDRDRGVEHRDEDEGPQKCDVDHVGSCRTAEEIVVLSLKHTARNRDDEQRRSPTFVSVMEDQDSSLSSQPAMAMDDPDMELSPPRRAVSSDRGRLSTSSSPPAEDGAATVPRQASLFPHSRTTPLDRNEARPEEPSLFASTDTSVARKTSHLSSRAPSRAASDAPLMMSSTLQQLLSEDSDHVELQEASGASHPSATEDSVAPPLCIPASSAFPSFGSAPRSAGVGRSSSSFTSSMASPPYIPRKNPATNSPIVEVPNSPTQPRGEDFVPTKSHEADAVAVLTALRFEDTTDALLTERRHRNRILKEYQQSWRMEIVVIWEQTGGLERGNAPCDEGPPVIDNAELSAEQRRISLRWRLCSEELTECLCKETVLRSLIASDESTEGAGIADAWKQSLRVARGLGPLKRQLLRYAQVRRQRNAARNIRRQRCLADEARCRDDVDAQRHTERVAILADAIAVQETYFRHQMYRLYAATTIASMYGWLWLLQRCEVYPICFAAPLSAVLRVSGRVCEASLFHLLSHEETSARSVMSAAWDDFHVSMRAHVMGAVLAHGQEAASRSVLLEEEIEERWMLCITRFKVMNMYQRREVELTSADERREVWKHEAAARCDVALRFTTTMPTG
jgi:hypothetical protein